MNRLLAKELADGIAARARSLSLLLSACLVTTVTPVHAFNESDRNLLTMAKEACKKRDYRAFFDAFARSKSVRQKYTAPTIQSALLGPHGEIISTRSVDAARYTAFPVRMEGFSYKPRQPARAGDTGEDLYLEFNQSQNNEISVDWSRINRDTPAEGEDAPGNPGDGRGKPTLSGKGPEVAGQLLFYPSADCWVFAEDIRWQPRP